MSGWAAGDVTWARPDLCEGPWFVTRCECLGCGYGVRGTAWIDVHRATDELECPVCESRDVVIRGDE